MSVFFAAGSQDRELSLIDLQEGLFEALDKLGSSRRVLAVPPDFTRYHSFAGDLTRYARQYYGEGFAAVLPALGTHTLMTSAEIEMMFGDLPQEPAKQSGPLRAELRQRSLSTRTPHHLCPDCGEQRRSRTTGRSGDVRRERYRVLRNGL
jgi:hypothetical protein